MLPQPDEAVRQAYQHRTKDEARASKHEDSTKEEEKDEQGVIVKALANKDGIQEVVRESDHDGSPNNKQRSVIPPTMHGENQSGRNPNDESSKIWNDG